MNIELYEGQSCNIYLTLQGEFEVYGGTTRSQFSVSKTESGEYKITVPPHSQSTCSSVRYEVFAKRVSDGKEWLVLTGKLSLKTRHSDTSGGLSPIEYHVTKTVTEDSVEVDGGIMLVGIKGEQGVQGERGIQGERGVQGIQGIQGVPGLSAYELVQQHGYSGTESEFVDTLTAFEAAAARAVDAQILAEVEAINAMKAAQDAAAILEELKTLKG